MKGKGSDASIGSEAILIERIYVSLQAYVEGVNPHPIETIVNSIVNEIRNVHVFRE